MGLKYQEISLISHEQNYVDMFVRSQIYIRFVLNSIVLINVMLAIEYLSYTTLFISWMFL